MRLLTLIPARGGSKRLPGKNTRILGCRPLIAWTIEAASNSGVLGDILVSTDDDAIAEIAMKWGGWVPWLRPEALATDISASIDVVLNALDWYEGEFGLVDGLILLQPTSPFRRPETILRAVDLFKHHNRQPVVSFSPAIAHPDWTFRVQNGVLVPFQGWQALEKRSQDLEPAYTLNGAIYLAAPETLRKQRSFLTESTVPLIMDDPAEALDIDTLWDWQLAEYFVSCVDNDGLV